MTALTIRLVFDNARERDIVVERYDAVEERTKMLDRLGELLAAGTPA
jgi:hypothetical protein